MKAQPVASHFVNGAYVEDKAGAPIEVVYPATGEVIAVVHEATAAVIEAALASATAAQGAWAATKPVERARILRRAADLIRARNDDLARLETLERREIAGAEGDFFGFETLTFAPIDRTLVDVALLTTEERAWFDGYHQQVRAVLAPQLMGADLMWLEAACAPL